MLLVLQILELRLLVLELARMLLYCLELLCFKRLHLPLKSLRLMLVHIYLCFQVQSLRRPNVSQETYHRHKRALLFADFSYLLVLSGPRAPCATSPALPSNLLPGIDIYRYLPIYIPIYTIYTAGTLMRSGDGRIGSVLPAPQGISQKFAAEEKD